MRVRLLMDALVVVNGKKVKRKAGAVVSVIDSYGNFLISFGFAEPAGDAK